MLSVLFLYRLIGPMPGVVGRAEGGFGHGHLAGLVEQDDLARVGDLRRGVLGVRVVDVEAGAVGEDDVGEPGVLVGEVLRGVVEGTGVGEAARVAQGGLLLIVPACPSALGELRAGGVGVDDLRGGHHRVGARLARHGDPVFDLGTHDAAYGHAFEPSPFGRGGAPSDRRRFDFRAADLRACEVLRLHDDWLPGAAMPTRSAARRSAGGAGPPADRWSLQALL